MLNPPKKIFINAMLTLNNLNPSEGINKVNIIKIIAKKRFANGPATDIIPFCFLVIVDP
jgi:hypothetical protein